jgi:MEMO1 family protein
MSRWILVASLSFLVTVNCREPNEATLDAVSAAAAASPGRARPAAHAGSWYTADASDVRRLVDEQPPLAAQPPVMALIGPHAGVRFSGEVAAKTYAQLKGQQIGRFFLIGPSHHAGFDGLALPATDLTAYSTPLGDLAIDTTAVNALRGLPGFGGPPQVHDAEHSLEMHAIFAAAVAPRALLVPLVAGRLGDDAQVKGIAEALRRLLKPGDVVLTSSDFTHYGPNYDYLPFTTNVEERLLGLLHAARDLIVKRDLAGFAAHLAKTGDTICGHGPIRLLLALLPADAAASSVAEDTSGRETHDFANSVSYLGIVFRRPGGWTQGAARAPAAERAKELTQGPQVLDAEERKLALRWARQTFETYVKTGKTLTDTELGVPQSGPFREQYAVFVTLKKDGDLRGCIGHILPIEPLWMDIRDNAVAAAVHDPRFEPVAASELARLDVEVSVLTRPQAIPSAEGFVVGRHGIILEVSGSRAVFLPQVAPEEGWDRATTLQHLSRKAGLAMNAWQRPEARFEVFEAQVFGERDAGAR